MQAIAEQDPSSFGGASCSPPYKQVNLSPSGGPQPPAVCVPASKSWLDEASGLKLHAAVTYVKGDSP